MNFRKLKASLIDLGVRLFDRTLYFLQFIPLWILSPLFALIALIIGLFSKRDRRIATAQVNFALISKLPTTITQNRLGSCAHTNITFADKIRIFYTVLGSFAHVGYSVGEIIKRKSLMGEKIPRPRHKLIESEQSPEKQITPADFDPVVQFGKIRLIGANIADYLIETNSGCIALAAHTGNFELLAATFAQYGSKLTIVARSPKYPALHKISDQVRRDYGLNLLWREDVAIARKLLLALQAGNIVALLIDQDTKLPNAFSEFFGLEAATPISPIRLALRARVPLLTAFIYRTGWQSHEIIIEQICDLRTEKLSEKEILQIYSKRLESIIREHPTQWPWWHKRWRRRPEMDYDKNPELLPSTAQYLTWLAEQSCKKRSSSNNTSVA